MSLSPEQHTSFTKVIDSILAASDINTISSKQIRQGLQATVDYDLNDYKMPVKELIMQRFDLYMSKKEEEEASTPSEDAIPTTERVNGNGHYSRTQETTPSSVSSPARKREADSVLSEDMETKKRRPEYNVDADAEFAAKLQAEENKRARPTRGSTTRKAAPSKKKSKSKTTTKRVRAEDDSDLDSGSETGAKKEVNRSGGFHKPLNLSPALSDLLDGEVALSRPQAVKRVWQYIKTNDLQDPSDRRQIRCDDRMRPVFKQDRIHMFTMTKILSQNLYEPGE